MRVRAYAAAVLGAAEYVAGRVAGVGWYLLVGLSVAVFVGTGLEYAFVEEPLVFDPRHPLRGGYIFLSVWLAGSIALWIRDLREDIKRLQGDVTRGIDRALDAERKSKEYREELRWHEERLVEVFGGSESYEAWLRARRECAAAEQARQEALIRQEHEADRQRREEAWTKAELSRPYTEHWLLRLVYLVGGAVAFVVMLAVLTKGWLLP